MIKEALAYLIDLGRQDVAAVDLPEHARIVSTDTRIDSIEHLMPGRTRYRTKVTTHDLESFIAMCSNKNMAPPQVYVDSTAMTATGYFNLGSEQSPGHGDHWVRLDLLRTPELDMALKVDGSPMSQQAMAEWLEDYRDFLTPVWDSESDSAGRTMQQAINAVRNVDITETRKAEQSVGTFSSGRTAIENIEAKGRDVPLPSRFIFDCCPYEGLQDRGIQMRLSMTTAGEKPKFTLRIVRLRSLEEDMTQEFASILSDRLQDEAEGVLIGKLSL